MLCRIQIRFKSCDVYVTTFVVVYFDNTGTTHNSSNTTGPSESDGITAIPTSECTLFDLLLTFHPQS